MTKRILVLFNSSDTASGAADPENLTNLLNDSRADATFVHWNIDELLYKVGSETVILNPSSNEDMKEFDFVYLRRWKNYESEAISIAIYLHKHGIPFADSEALKSGSMSKMSQYYRLWEADLRIPSSVFMPTSMIEQHFDDIKSSLGDKVVAKAVDGTRGNDNFILEASSDLMNLRPESKYVLQEFIPNECDYRILVMGEEVKMAIKRSNPDDFRNNVSLGGTAERVSIDSINIEVISQSVAAARHFNRDIAGVDLILDEGGEAVFLEVNRSPQIDGGASYSEQKASLLAEYLVAQAKDS